MSMFSRNPRPQALWSRGSAERWPQRGAATLGPCSTPTPNYGKEIGLENLKIND